MPKIDIDVDKNGVGKKLKEAIEGGIEDAAEEIGDEATKEAKSKIRVEGAIWEGDLIASFEDDVKREGGNVILKVRNVSEHAGPQEHGAEYTDKAPPLQHLLPWVRDNLSHMWFEDQEWKEEVAEYFRREGVFTGWTDDEIVRAYWLQQKIYKEGLDAVEFMKEAEKWIRKNGDKEVARGIDKELKKYGFS